MKVILVLLALVSANSAFADAQLDTGLKAIHGRAGCFLVDYSFVETKAIKPGYVKDDRVYDVNRNMSVKEWIVVDDVSPTRTHVQHVLFATSLDGKYMDGSLLKHVGEDWEYNAPFLYNFVGTNHWMVNSLAAQPNVWTRRITNLDDGLRYQCAAPWNLTTAYPEWSCNDYAPIPGREYRDMGRKDYNTLQRQTRLIVYDQNALEREDNVKTIDDNGVQTPLAAETGKTWYVRLPDSECAVAQDFVKAHKPFWTVMRQAWDDVYNGKSDFFETPNVLNRYYDIMGLEEQYEAQDLSNPTVQSSAKDAIKADISKYRLSTTKQ